MLRNPLRTQGVTQFVGGRFYRPMTKGTTVVMFLFFGAVFAGMGVLAISTVVGESRQSAKLDSEGLHTSATVKEHYDYAGKDPTLDLAFSVNGTNYEQPAHVTPKDYFGVQDGGSVQIAYLRNDPKQFKVVGSTYVHTPKKFIAVGGVAAAIGLSLIVYGVYFGITRPPDTAV